MKIEIENLSFSYGNRPVLQNVSFSAGEGEFVSLLGPNGVGKSTLFRCLLGLQRGYTGTIRVEGSDVMHLPPREMAHRVAYIPQSNSPTFNYTVLEMVLMGTTHRVRGLSSPRGEEVALAEEALQRIGILRLRDRGYGQLSGGERQMVLIARALAQQAKILVMDEPTSNLDYGNQLRVLMEVKKLSEEGYTVLVSSHNPQQALLFSDRILALADGTVAADGPPREAVNAALLERLYGIPVRLMETGEGSFVIPILKGD